MTKKEKIKLGRALARCYLAAPGGEIEDHIGDALDLLVGRKMALNLVATVPDDLLSRKVGKK